MSPPDDAVKVIDAASRYDFSGYLDKVKEHKPSPVRSVVEGKRAFEYDGKPVKMGMFNKRYHYRPSSYAHAFHNAPHKIRSLCWGIKSGKTRVGAVETCRYAQKYKNILVWVVGATNKLTDEAERMVLEILDTQEGVIVSRKESERKYVLFNGTKIEFRTGTNPNNLRGPNVHFAWIDEGAFANHDVFKEIQKRTAATKGKIIVTTTPWGKNWFYEECLRASMPKSAPYGEFGDDVNRHWISHRKTEEFPWVAHDELAEFRKDMTKTEYEQEFEAKFTARINAAFKKIPLHWKPCKYIEGNRYIMGLDLGKSQDYTAVVVTDSRGRVMVCERWKDVAYGEGIRRVIAIHKAWGKCPIIVDASNVGVYVIEEMTKMKLPVYPVNFNSPSVKNDVIMAHQIAMENNRFQIPHPESKYAPADANTVKEEHEEYRVTITDKSRISYSAPKGEHDDFVVAGALCTWGKVRALAALECDADAVSQSLQTQEDIRKEIEDRRKTIQVMRSLKRRSGRVHSTIMGSGYIPNRYYKTGTDY